MTKILLLVCNKCGKNREIIKYFANGKERTRSICKPCHSKQSYETRKKRRKDYLRQVREKAQTNTSNRAYLLWRRAKDRSTKRNLEFSITREQIHNLLNVGICQVTGLAFDLTFDENKMNPLSPSIDRIDPKKGYTPDNIQMVCWVYNRAKGDGSAEDVWLLVEAMNAIKITRAA